MKYLYHITTRNNLQKIMDSGGLIARKSKYNLIFRLNFKAPKAVYLSNHPLWLAAFGFDKNVWNLRNEFVVLKVNVGGLKIEKEFNHPSAYYFAGNISKARIVDVFYLGDHHLTYDIKRRRWE